MTIVQRYASIARDPENLVTLSLKFYKPNVTTNTATNIVNGAYIIRTVLVLYIMNNGFIKKFPA
jgi:hypothetical protein